MWQKEGRLPQLTEAGCWELSTGEFPPAGALVSKLPGEHANRMYTQVGYFGGI